MWGHFTKMYTQMSIWIYMYENGLANAYLNLYLTLHLNYVAGHTDPLLFLFERTQQPTLSINHDFFFPFRGLFRIYSKNVHIQVWSMEIEVPSPVQNIWMFSSLYAELNFFCFVTFPTSASRSGCVCGVCCFVLLTRYWGIVTVPGCPRVNRPGIITWGGRVLTLHLNYVAGYTGSLLFLFERTRNYYVDNQGLCVALIY